MDKIILSPYHKIFYNEWKLQPDSNEYNIVFDQTISKELDIERLRNALSRFVSDHLIINSHIIETNEDVYWIKNSETKPLEYFPYNKDTQQNIVKWTLKPFNLNTDSLYRFAIFQNLDNTYRFIIVLHHLLIDGPSGDSFITNISNYYNSTSYKTKYSISTQVSKIITTTQQLYENINLTEQASQSFWRNNLSNIDPVDLRFFKKSNNEDTECYPHNIGELRFNFDVTILAQIKEVQKKYKISIYFYSQMIFALLLYKYTSQKRFAVSYPVAIKKHFNLIYGAGINTTFLVYEVHQHSRIINLIETITQTLDTSDLDLYRMYPVSNIIRNADKDLLDIFFAQTNLKDTRFSFTGSETLEINKDFNIDLVQKLIFEQEISEDINFRVRYNRLEISEIILKNFITSYKKLFLDVLNDLIKDISDKQVFQYSILDEKEYNSILQQSSKLSTQYCNDKTIHELFEYQVTKTPNNLALVYGKQKFSYNLLNKKANQLAHYLVDEYNIKSNDFVALYLERNEYLLICILAILKAGGAYLPLDTSFPDERLKFILSNSQPKLLITSEINFSKITKICPTLQEQKPLNLQNKLNSKLILIDSQETQKLISSQKTNNLKNYETNNLVYSLYTSGTTGIPKGVLMNHKSCVNRILEMVNISNISNIDKVLFKTNYVFDVSFSDIFSTWLSGACLFQTEDIFDIEEIENIINNNSINICHFTPSQFAAILNSKGSSLFQNFKVINFSGEPLNPKLLSNLNKKIQCINYYGPTETGEVSYEKIELDTSHNSPITIGYPFKNTQLFILDEALTVLPIGAIGELYIGGICLAAGYVNNKGLTDEKFILSPFQNVNNVPDTKLYKTGDFVRRLPNGNIEYIGRNDSQVKIRGFRIELNEIENKLALYPGIKQAIITTGNINRGDGTDDKYLIAYYVAEQKLNELEIQNYMLLELPEYMVPNIFIHMDTIPLNNNGKIDIKTLPDVSFISSEYVAPRTQLETQLCKIYSDILKLDPVQVGIRDSFFKLGGNSISAIKLISKINQELNCNLKVKDLFQKRIIENLAPLISGHKNSFLYKDYLVTNLDNSLLYQPFELSNIQQAYYFGRLNNFALGNISTHFYCEYVFKCLNLKKLEQSLNKLIERHHSLRTIFRDGMQQYVESYPYYTIDFYSLKSQNELGKLRSQFSHKVYDISNLWLFDVFISEYDNQVRLHFSIDALIIDAVSLQVFFDELTTLYRNTEVILPKLEINYHDYIKQYNKIRQSTLFQEAKTYWLAKANNFNFNLSLPLKQKADFINSPRFTRITKELDKDTWSKLKTKLYSHGIGPTTFVLCAYSSILAYWSNQNNVCINLTLFNRLPLHKQINNIIGDFTITELFNFKGIKRTDTILDILQDTQFELWADIEHSIFDGLDFQRLIREINPGLANNQILAPVVLTSLLGSDYINKNFIDESFIKTDYSITQTSQVWLDNKAYERDGKLVAEWDYVADLFDPATIQFMYDDYFNIIKYLATTDWDKSWPEVRLPEEHYNLILNANNEKQPLINDTIFEHYENLTIKNNLFDQIAVIDENDKRQYKYKQLLSDSEVLSKYICYLNSSKPNCALIAVCNDKSYNIVIATLAIMKSGAGYLPVNMDWPIERVKEILTQGKIKQILISKKQYEDSVIKSELSKQFEFIIIDEILENFSTTKENILADVSLPKVLPNSIAYVIFTSGSTGIPKGVTISHISALNTIIAVNNKFKVNKEDKILAISELSFDLSVYDIFGVLIAGGTIVFPQKNNLKQPRHWLELINKYRITLWNSVPQLAELLIDEAEQSDLYIAYLRVFLLSGDWVPTNLYDKLKQHCYKSRIISLGGATEGSIWSIWYEINKLNAEWNSIPYGQAMPNQKMYVLNYDNNHCPVGVIGDIYIGGDGVALNYYNNQEKTKTSFIIHPELGRLYKTGDLGRWHPDGYMEFIGRTDNQVKIRGYRVELEEISAKIAQIDPEINALTLVHKYDNSSYIVSYYSGKQIEEQKIISFLDKRLPEYMIPTKIIYIENIPLTTNGKIDINALPVPKIIDELDNIAPTNLQEKLLVDAFSKVLKVEKISINSDFFKLGGNSLSAIQLVSVLQTNFDINLTDIFSLRTPQAIANKINFGTNYIHKKLSLITSLYSWVNSSETVYTKSDIEPNIEIYYRDIQSLKYEFKKKIIGNVLLTGSTGYLGCNVLNQLLTLTNYNIHLLIRAHTDQEALDRILHKFYIYFGKDLKLFINKRLFVYKSDIEQPQLGLLLNVYNHLITITDSVIHCAALVKHYGEYDNFYSANVVGTRNLLEFTQLTRLKDFHYISTYAALYSDIGPEFKQRVFTENDSLHHVETINNFYARSKLQGELLVEEFKTYGLSCNIYRVGNLAFMAENYQIQENIEDNAFYNWIKCLVSIKCFAKEISKIEVSPVDLTAKAIVKLFDKDELSNHTYHVFNPYLYDFSKSLYNYEPGQIQQLPIDKFINRVAERLDCCKEHQNLSMKFILRQGWLDGTDLTLLNKFNKVVQDKTQHILQQLGFEWEPISDKMFTHYINAIYPTKHNN